MKSAGSIIRLACRAAIWRTTPEPPLVGVSSVLVWAFALAVLRVAFQFTAAGPGAAFNPYGLNAVVAWLALGLAIAALFVQPAARATALSSMLALTILAEFVISAAKFASASVPPLAVADVVWLDNIVRIATFAAVSLWWIAAMVAVLRSFAVQPRLRVLGRAAALWLALVAVSSVIPHAPVFIGENFDIRTANLWETLRARFVAPEQGGGGAQTEIARLDERSQRSLLQAEIARLAPPTKGATDVYAIGLAGWADQDVFLKELDGGLAAVGGVLPIRGRTVRLVNHRETLESVPLATQRNFAAAVHAVSAVMNKDEDVLLLLLTSHGEPTGFDLRVPNEGISELTPQEVAATLNNEGIKNRIVIVSACYAGAFVPPLANDDTIVLTAADAKSTSFGCAPERDWTYFGDAFFRQSIRPGRDFQHAFDNARTLIQGWELMDRAPPSNPQAHFGPALVARLAPFFESGQTAGR
jgi:hypothetical protein